MAHGLVKPPAASPTPCERSASSFPSSTRQHFLYRLTLRQRAPLSDTTTRASRRGLTQGDGPSPRRVALLEGIRSRARRQWRTVALLVAVCATITYLCVREPLRPPLVVPKRPYALHQYRHLDGTLPMDLEPSTRVLHVTKEFGPATMGGLGVMLTALSVAQSNSPYLSISVALPHYSYLREQYAAHEVVPFANLSIPFAPKPSTRRIRPVHCPVSLLRWQYTPASDFLDPGAVPRRVPQRSIDVYLIGPGEERPFSAAFRAKDPGDIYSAYKPLKQEWKDLYFASAAAELVRYLGAGGDPGMGLADGGSGDGVGGASAADTTSFARRPSDVVHLHGATNAVVAHFLRERERDERRPPDLAGRAPAIVYTLHDSLDEVEYSNLAANVAHFVIPSNVTPGDAFASLRPYIYRSGTQLFTSALGIDLADMTTFVSRSIAADIVSGKFRFHLEDLVMPSISARAGRGEFVGVTNGLDFTERSRNPFTHDKLVAQGLAFPRVGQDVLDPSTYGVSFAAAKDRARAFVVQHLPHLFSPDEVGRPWFLFIGRYQYNKGCQLFSSLLEVLSSPAIDGRLILLGARNNYPFDELTRLVKRFPRNIVLVDDRSPSTSTVQAEWGAHLRLASDIAYVPSLSEAFGLVAAEALLFGMPVLSTGVGGLREFLVPPPDPRANSYLFDLFPRLRGSSSTTSSAQGAEEDWSQAAHDVRPDEARLAHARAELRRAAEHALRDWRARRDGPAHERERYTRRLVADALALTWDREDGPVDEYLRVYSEALRLRRRRLRLASDAGPPILAGSASSSSSSERDDAPGARINVEPGRTNLLPRAAEGREGLPEGEGEARAGVGLRAEVDGVALAVRGFARAAERAHSGGVLPIVKVWSGEAEGQVMKAEAEAAVARRAKRQGKKRGARAGKISKGPGAAPLSRVAREDRQRRRALKVDCL